MIEKQFKSFVKKAMKSKENTTDILVQMLEGRLDNTIFRMGLAQSRDQARQLVNHGHILVNGIKTSIPSFQVKKGNKISIREGSKKTKYFSSNVAQWIKNYTPPLWIKLDQNNYNAEIVSIPTTEESGLNYSDLQSTIEFYSR